MAKEKAQTQRSYDDDGYKKRAACVCVKNEHENEVLLISSTRDKQRWIIPGGGIECNENPEDAAAREVLEEAGVVGRLGRLLGVFENKERRNRTNVYLLIVDEELPEWEENKKYGRVRKWFYLDEAKRELEMHKPVQGTYLNLLKGFHHLRQNHHPHPNHHLHHLHLNNNHVIQQQFPAAAASPRPASNSKLAADSNEDINSDGNNNKSSPNVVVAVAGSAKMVVNSIESPPNPTSTPLAAAAASTSVRY